MSLKKYNVRKKDITSVREHTKKNLVEVDENGGAGELKNFEKLSHGTRSPKK